MSEREKRGTNTFTVCQSDEYLAVVVGLSSADVVDGGGGCWGVWEREEGGRWQIVPTSAGILTTGGF